MTSNLKVVINGPKAPYKFNYELVKPLNESINENETFQEMVISLKNIHTDFLGDKNEVITITLNDYSAIRDKAENPLTEQQLMGNLKRYDYVPKGNFTPNNLFRAN